MSLSRSWKWTVWLCMFLLCTVTVINAAEVPTGKPLEGERQKEKGKPEIKEGERQPSRVVPEPVKDPCLLNPHLPVCYGQEQA
jgi:hypothetical protein